MSLARRNLFQDKTRLALSISGVALSVMLILILKGFLAGMNRQITSYLDQSPGSIVIADEPTANLDSKIGHEIMRLLRHIAKEQGRSVVIVSHDQRIKDIADRILWLEDGEFKEMVTTLAPHAHRSGGSVPGSAGVAVDPVCGMAVEQEKAVSLERSGMMYYFCASGCRNEFLNLST